MPVADRNKGSSIVLQLLSLSSDARVFFSGSLNNVFRSEYWLLCIPTFEMGCFS
jgi:hypothetical protein